MKGLVFEWHRSGEEIADFLSKANPNWPRAILVNMITNLSTPTRTRTYESISTATMTS
jgi:hypothetical protein